jgi:hypothetical protein
MHSYLIYCYFGGIIGILGMLLNINKFKSENREIRNGKSNRVIKHYQEKPVIDQ